jgi:hypothetical protein
LDFVGRPRIFPNDPVALEFSPFAGPANQPRSDLLRAIAISFAITPSKLATPSQAQECHQGHISKHKSVISKSVIRVTSQHSTFNLRLKNTAVESFKLNKLKTIRVTSQHSTFRFCGGWCAAFVRKQFPIIGKTLR